MGHIGGGWRAIHSIETSSSGSPILISPYESIYPIDWRAQVGNLPAVHPSFHWVYGLHIGWLAIAALE